MAHAFAAEPCRPCWQPSLLRPAAPGQGSRCFSASAQSQRRGSSGLASITLAATAVTCGLVRGSLPRRRRRFFAGSSLRTSRAVISAGPSDSVIAETPTELGEWCALFINLTRRDDRRARLEQLLGKTNAPLLARLERVEAVDKESLTLDDEIVVDAVHPAALERARRALNEQHYTIIHDDDGNLVHFDDHLTLGGIACALSHRLALERIASHPTAEWGLVLEDDVNAVAPRVDLAIAKLMRELPDDWDAVCLGYHDPRGRVHPSAVSSEPLDPSLDGVQVELIQSSGHVFGLGAWMVRKAAAKALVENAFPIESQVDYTLTNWLACSRRRLWKVDPTNLLFYAPSSEEEMDSDVQTMVPLDKIVEEHDSLQSYINHMKGRTADPYLDLDFDYGDYQFDEEEWMRNWQAERYEEYYGTSSNQENLDPDPSEAEVGVSEQVDATEM